MISTVSKESAPKSTNLVRRDGVEVRAKLFGDDASDLVESVARLRVVVR